MKKQRLIYSLLFGIPGILVSVFVGLFLGGTAGGFLWIFVYGDSQWPLWTEYLIPILTGFGFIISLIVIIKIGYSFGKKREIEEIPISIKHVMISLGILLLLIVRLITF